MDEKKALFQHLKWLKQQLAKIRRNWFLGMWLGYSVVAFWLIIAVDDINNVSDFLTSNPMEFLGLLFTSMVLGLISWYVNMIVWTICCRHINDLVSLCEKTEKEYNNMH